MTKPTQLYLSVLLYVLSIPAQAAVGTTAETPINPSNTQTQEMPQDSMPAEGQTPTSDSAKDKTQRFVPREKLPADSAVSFPTDI